MMLRLFIFATALLMAYPAFAEGVRVVVPNHDIARGELITESDLVYGTIPASTVFTGYITSMNDLAGMEARRVLRAGENRAHRGCPPPDRRHQGLGRHHDVRCARRHADRHRPAP